MSSVGAYVGETAAGAVVYPAISSDIAAWIGEIHAILIKEGKEVSRCLRIGGWILPIDEPTKV